MVRSRRVSRRLTEQPPSSNCGPGPRSDNSSSGLRSGHALTDRQPHPMHPSSWSRLSARWHADLTERNDQLTRQRDQLDGCIGCGCLSVSACPLRNPLDELSERGPGPQLLESDERGRAEPG